jgi:FecR protein
MRLGLSVAVLALLSTTPAWAATPGWSVSERSGSVSVLHNGIGHIAIKDSFISTGDIIATGVNGRAVLVRGEEFLVIAPNSRLRIADPEQTGGLVQIMQDAGNVIFRIKRMTMQHFAVKTPYLAAVVKGTTFSVSVGPEGASVQVIEGAVEVATADGGAHDLLRPGMVAAVSARDMGRLKMDGDSPHDIVSPNAPAPAPETQDSVMPASADIDAPVMEPAQSVAELTGGLVEGNAAATLMMASVDTVRVARAEIARQGAGEVLFDSPVATPPVDATAAIIAAPVAPAAPAVQPTVSAAASVGQPIQVDAIAEVAPAPTPAVSAPAVEVAAAPPTVAPPSPVASAAVIAVAVAPPTVAPPTAAASTAVASVAADTVTGPVPETIANGPEVEVVVAMPPVPAPEPVVSAPAVEVAVAMPPVPAPEPVVSAPVVEVVVAMPPVAAPEPAVTAPVVEVAVAAAPPLVEIAAAPAVVATPPAPVVSAQVAVVAPVVVAPVAGNGFGNGLRNGFGFGFAGRGNNGIGNGIGNNQNNNNQNNNNQIGNNQVGNNQRGF